MLINALAVVFALLCVYWFAFKEGFFSSVVHLLCVIVAGALTFAFWEPLALAMLDSSGAREWAWGVSFLALFSIFLFILRLSANFAIPEKINFPNLVDMLGGGVTGACTGVLTVGMLMLGVGFLPVGDLGGVGFRRDGSGQPTTRGTVVPFAAMTERFYAGLSKGAFAPMTNSGNLAASYPEIARQAWALQRDTDERGRIELTAAPSDLTVGTPYKGAFGKSGEEFYVVPVKVSKSGFHRGASFVLSASQARLVGAASGKQTAKSVFPTQWREGGKVYPFDGQTNYATNLPGAQEVALQLAFPAGKLEGQTPSFLLFKGLRVPLGPASDDVAVLGSGGNGGGAIYDKNAPFVPAPYVETGTQLGVLFNKNDAPSGMEISDGAVTFADGVDVPSYTQGNPSRSLRVERVYELPGTKVVRVDVSRGKSPIDIWGDVRNTAGEDAKLVIVDSDGNTYDAIGWLHKKTSDRLMHIKVDDRNGVDSIGAVPMLSSAGKDSLVLLFRVPKGRDVKAIMLGDKTIATTNLKIN
ncbi:MAG: CvpA family protein [Phycisphaera sp. TMED9]|nr:MAG: CvpA family protein [Phycisphaera sp. TMED9]